MGGCLSKKKEPPTPPKTPNPNEPPVQVEKPTVASQQAEPVAAEKKPVFIVTQTKKASSSSSSSAVAATPEEKDDKKGETPKRIDSLRPAPVRTSSCTTEEVDAILIQCGRLSRSASGKAANGAPSARKCSGSKRSYDFDERRRGDEEDWERPVHTRPSPRRRTPSRERGSGEGRRRVSRSPGRRSEGLTPSGDRLKQPAKMVSVPAREKGGAAAVSKLRSQSPRSQSPANNRSSNENSHHISHPQPQPQPLSRNSSRKAEQSPHRRNPMVELNENSPAAEEHPWRKTNQSLSQKASEGLAQVRKAEQKCVAAGEIPNGIKSNNAITDCVREQLLAAKEPEIVEEAMEAKGGMKGVEALLTGAGGHYSRTIARNRSSRRSSRDLDHCLGLPNAYNSLHLEDIHSYQQQNNTAFSLPACVSKACLILEAVADLNSSLSDNKSYEGGWCEPGKKGLVANEPFVESEIVVKDDLMEPSLHRYVTVSDWGGETEPQESAGSNSFVGQPWASPWGHTSVDSTGRRSNATGEEVAEDEEEFSPMEQQLLQHKQQQAVPDAGGRRVRGGGSSTSSLAVAAATPSGGKKRESDHRLLHRRGSGGSAVRSVKAGGRASAVPVAAAAAAASS